MTGNILEEFRSLIGENNVLTGDSLHNRYDHIWRMNNPLQAKALLLPATTEDVSGIMKICHRYQQAIVMHGGLTNLVGSTKVSHTEVVISTEKMNTIEEVDSQSRTMTVQAGVILEHLHYTANSFDLIFPLNFGAKGSAQIGGIISTNAGGLRVLKYGMCRNLVLGLEVVLADGTIINSLKKIVKDNSAYDLKQLFIGSEGTLGIITRATLKLVEAPQSRVSSFSGFNAYSKVVDFLKFLDKNLSGKLSGYELIWQHTYKAMTSPPSLSRPPLDYSYKYYVLTEMLGSNQLNDQQEFENILEQALENELIEDALVAQTEADLNWFWRIREDVHAFVSLCTYDQHFDISLPIPLIGDYINAVTEKIYQLDNIEHVFPFGHVADGNMHLVIGKKNNDLELTQAINDIVYTPLKAIGGSISAEHGIGLDKKRYLHLCRTEEEINLMRQLKNMLDPLCLLNRGKVLDFNG
jgi:FAD/FMN-containing dehydrogenase